MGHDPRNLENDKTIAHNPDVAIADLPNIITKNVPRRSTRNSKVKTVRTSTSSLTSSLTSSSDTMGAELSSIDAPISVNIELKVGEEELAKVRELWRQVDGTGAGRQGNDTRGAWIEESSAPIVSDEEVNEDVEVLIVLTLLFLVDLLGTFSVIIFGKSAIPASVFLCAIVLSFSGFLGSCSGCRGLRYLLCLVVRLFVSVMM